MRVWLNPNGEKNRAIHKMSFLTTSDYFILTIVILIFSSLAMCMIIWNKQWNEWIEMRIGQWTESTRPRLIMPPNIFYFHQK